MTISQRLDKIQMLLKTADASVLEKIERMLERSTAEVDNSSLTTEQKEILDVRLANHDSNPSLGRNWKDIKTELWARHGV